MYYKSQQSPFLHGAPIACLSLPPPHCLVPVPQPQAATAAPRRQHCLLKNPAKQAKKSKMGKTQQNPKPLHKAGQQEYRVILVPCCRKATTMSNQSTIPDNKQWGTTQDSNPGGLSPLQDHPHSLPSVPEGSSPAGGCGWAFPGPTYTLCDGA